MQHSTDVDQGVIATPSGEGVLRNAEPSQYVAYRPAWSSRSISAMPSTSTLAASTTNSTYPGPRPNSARAVSGSPDSGANLVAAPTWVKQYTESSVRSKRSPRPTTPRQPWDENDYPQTRSPEELLGGPGSPPSGRERLTSSASDRPSVGLGLSSNPRNSSSSTLSYFPQQASLDEVTERHLKSRASTMSIGGGPMSLAQQIALDERRKKAQAELARLHEDENERLRLIDSNTSQTESVQEPVQPEVRHNAQPPPPYTSNPPVVEHHHDIIEPKSLPLEHVKPSEPTFELSPPPELSSTAAFPVVPSIVAPESQQQVTTTNPGEDQSPDSPSGGSLFSDLDDLVSKLGSRRRTSSAYAAPRPPRPQSFSNPKRQNSTVPTVPELPSNPSLAPRFDTFELSTSESVRRPKPKVLEAPRIHEPHPAAQFELSSSDSVVRRPKSSSITALNKHPYEPLEPPHATHFELSTSPSVLRRPKSQSFQPPHNSAPLEPPPATHFELSTSDSVIRRPKSQTFVPLRYTADGGNRKSHPPTTTAPQGAWFDRWQTNFEANQKFNLPMVPQRHPQQ
ncbi:MAG: hypothetical protein M1812_005178 [Candelaria pacifica]|nr:MAG: hypothetical protein M1812_005178 [Candelaria pacifica]